MHPFQVLHSMSSRGDAPKGIDRATVARVWEFSTPYRGKVIGFVVLIIISTIVGPVSYTHLTLPTTPYV